MKTIETRSWSTSYRGPLAIHAAARLPEVGEKVGDYRVAHAYCPPDAPWQLWPEAAHLRRTGVVMPLGAVVATCTLVDVVATYPHMLVEHKDQVPYGDFAPGRFAWLLADIKSVDPPVPARGRQQLWEWSA